MRYFMSFAVLLALAGGSTLSAQQSEIWRRGYEDRLERTETRYVAPLAPDLYVAPGTERRYDDPAVGQVIDRSLQRPLDRPMDRAARFQGDDDFISSWQSATWPTPSRSQEPRSRVRRDPYADSLYEERVPNTDYRNPYRDYRLSDSNRFNNDSDYLSPADLHYRSRVRPMFFGDRRYDEVEQRVDDQTSANPGVSMGMRNVLSPRLDMSRWR